MKIIKQIRISNDLTQQNIADKLEITKSAYANIENGYKTPSLQLALRIQNLFKKEISYLLSDIE